LFQLALLDMQMPEMDGVMLATRIREDQRWSRTKLLLFTSLGEAQVSKSVKETLFDGWLWKPITKTQLLESITKAISQDGRAHPTTSPNSGSSAPGNSDIGTAQASIRVLLAEDNVVNQRVILRQLQKLGYSPDLVPNGREVIEAISRVPYDIVLMDCQMPEMDGYEACRELRRKQAPLHSTVVIAMTAGAMEEDRKRCFESGMDDYISKPVQLDQLAQVLSRWSVVQQ
jgi:CheY-like chemotaxis protein